MRKFADQKVNEFGPAHIEKSHFKGVFGCIFWQRFIKYGGNKSIKENSFVLRRARHHLLHALLSSLIFTCKNCLDWDIFHYFYFFTKYIVLLSLIVKKWSLHISYNMKTISLSFCSIQYDIFNLYTCKKRKNNEFWDCATS